MPRVCICLQVVCGEADMLEILPDDVPNSGISTPLSQPQSDSSKMVRYTVPRLDETNDHRW